MMNLRRQCSVHGHYIIQNFKQFLQYSTATSKLTDESTQLMSNYLINSLGFSQKQALSVCNKLRSSKVNHLKIPSHANSVINLFKNHDFDDTHVKKIVSLYPKLLFSDVDKTLIPKFEFFQNQGFSSSDIIRVILVNPSLLHSDPESVILPVIQALREVMGHHDNSVNVITKLYMGKFRFVSKSLLPNVAWLRDRGVPIDLIRKQLSWKPEALLIKPEHFEDVAIRAEKKLGISHESPRYMHVIYLLSRSSEAKIESKCQLFKCFGWTQSDFDAILEKNPCCFHLSDASMKKKLDFLMNELRLEPAQLISHSAFLTCSLEKRMVPRYKVLRILNDKHLVIKIPAFYSAVCMSESRFLKMFVLPFKEVHDVYAKYTGCDLKMLTQLMKATDS